MADESDEALVYSTEQGRLCPSCKQAIENCCCARQPKSYSASKDGFVRLRRETKGRKGKGVVIISGLALSESKLKALAKALKKKCGAGGSVKEGEIEIQGDQQQLIAEELRRRGFQVK